MIKKGIFLFIAIIFIVTLVLVLIVYYNAYYSLGRNLFLYANDKQGAILSETSQGNDDLNAFFASPYENLALYKPVDKSNNISSKNFYGNLQNYDKVKNNKVSLSVWKNDFVSEQLVIKTKNFNLQNVTVNIKDSSSKNLSAVENINIIYGFNRYIYSSYEDEGLGTHNGLAIHQPFILPDAITNQKNINLQKNNVYIVWIKFLTNDKIMSKETYNFNITLSYSIYENLEYKDKVFSEPLLINLNVIPIDAKNAINKNQNSFDFSDFYIYTFFGWTAAYYNDRQVPSVNPKTGATIDPTNELDYFDYNWDYYWKPEAKYLHDIYGVSYFQLPIALTYSPDIHFDNNWEVKGFSKTQSMLHWETDNNTTLHNHSYYLPKNDIAAFDKYIESMGELGYNKLFLAGWQGGDVTNPITCVYNKAANKYEKIDLNISHSEGKINNKFFLEWIINHIKNKINDPTLSIKQQEDWQKIKFYLYLDELSDKTITGYSNLIDSNKDNKNREYMKFAICDPEKDLNFNNPVLLTADILYFYIFDIYNEQDNNFTQLVNKRKNAHLLTGQYFLDSDYTFNLTRAEPGVLDYITYALNKENAPHYMRYLLNGWNLNKAYWSSDYDENSQYQYTSGDTIFAYPFVNVKEGDKPANVTIPAEGSYDNFNPSVRLENIALGTNINNKLEYLKENNKISSKQLETIFNAIDIRTKQSSMSDHTKFNFNFNNTDVKYNVKKSNSFINRYLSAECNIDEITVVKVINNIIHNCELNL